MLNFPYGIADFRRIRRDGMVYVDRTAHIRDLESLGSTLVFLRPRRFGKSLWVQTLATYYDLRYAERFDEIFGGLAIHDDPTPLQGRFFVLQWNFSLIKPRGGIDEIAKELREHVSAQAKAFVSDYEEHLPAPVETDGRPQSVLISLLAAVRRTPYKLYLLIDEYDNFVNEVMVRDVATYKALFEADGPYKELMKSVKNATEGLGLERIFVTGVSPVALNDLTSGFNTATNVSLRPELAALCGFHEGELRDLLDAVAQEKSLSAATVEGALDTMRTWYNGYRFTNYPTRNLPAGARNGVYNPINVLYFLKHLYDFDEPPEVLQDENLRTDQAKLAFLARHAVGAGVVEQLTEGGDQEVNVRLVKSFSIRDLTEGLRKDAGTVASMLYYMGLLTHTETPFRLRIPNLVVRKLFLERLLAIYLPDQADLSEDDTGDDGSGSGVNETSVKILFLSMLFADDYYRIFSEPELEKGSVPLGGMRGEQHSADLCLLTRPEARHYGFRDLLFEFKLVRKKGLGLKGRELRELDDAELRELPKVAKAFADARQQAERYRAVLAKQEDALDLRTYAVVGVGLERILGEEL
jgi:hypothetical protein